MVSVTPPIALRRISVAVGIAISLMSMAYGYPGKSLYVIFPDNLYGLWFAVSALALLLVIRRTEWHIASRPWRVALLSTVFCCIVTQLITGLLNRGSWLSPECACVGTGMAIGVIAGALLPEGIWPAILAGILILCQSIAIVYSRSNGLYVIHSGSLRREMGLYVHPIELISAMAVFMPLLLVPIEASRASLRKVVIVSVWIMGLICGLLTGYRLAAIVLAAPLLITRKVVPKFRPIVVVAALLLVGLSFFARYSGPNEAASSSRSNYGRAAQASQAISQFVRHPLTGVGIGQLRMEVNEVSGGSLAYPMGPRSTYHWVNNLYIQILGEQGLLGFVWFGVLIFAFVKINDGGSINGRARLASSAGLLLLGLTECSFGIGFNLTGNVLFGFLVAQSLTSPSQQEDSSCGSPKPRA